MILTRIFFLITRPYELATLTFTEGLKYFSLGLLQDIIYLSQLYLVYVLIPKRLKNGFIKLSILILPLYFLIDFLFMYFKGIRFSLGLSSYFQFYSAFKDSLPPSLLYILLPGPIILLLVLFFNFSQSDKTKIKLWPIILILLINPPALLLFSYFNDSKSYHLDNIVILEELNFITHNIVTNKETLPKYNKIQGPISTNPKKAISKNTNVVFIFLESFRHKNFGPKYSPYLWSLKNKSLYFSNFYTNGVQTSRALLASLYGEIPAFHEQSKQSRGLRVSPGIPHVMKATGHKNIYIHNGYLKFENKTEFLKKNGFDEILGHHDILKSYPNSHKFSWGVHDEYLYKYTLEKIKQIKQKKRPFFLTLFTVSNHHPWAIPENFKQFKDAGLKNNEYNEYLKSYQYTDYAVGNFLKELNDQKLDKDTIFFILADTGAAMGENYNNYMNIKYLNEESIHIPLIIYSPQYFEPQVITSNTSQLDLLPTISDLFKKEINKNFIGVSLLRERPRNVPIIINNPYCLGEVLKISNGRKELKNTNYCTIFCN